MKTKTKTIKVVKNNRRAAELIAELIASGNTLNIHLEEVCNAK